jgi:hypothetical protein
MSPESIVAIIAVIITGIVSVVNGFIPLLINWITTRRESEKEIIQRIDQTTIELLKELSNFRHWVAKDIKDAAGTSLIKAYTNLQVKQYAWERAVWNQLDNNFQNRVRQLRFELETLHTPTAISNEKRGTSHLSELSSEILAITNMATNR